MAYTIKQTSLFMRAAHDAKRADRRDHILGTAAAFGGGDALKDVMKELNDV